MMKTCFAVIFVVSFRYNVRITALQQSTAILLNYNKILFCFVESELKYRLVKLSYYCIYVQDQLLYNPLDLVLQYYYGHVKKLTVLFRTSFTRERERTYTNTNTSVFIGIITSTFLHK